MVAFNILTDEEENLIPVSPKESVVKKVAVTADYESLIDNNMTKVKCTPLHLIILIAPFLEIL